MTYAYITDGLEPDQKDDIDKALMSTGGDEKSKARRERDAIGNLAGFVR